VDGLAILDTPLDQTMAIARTQNATMDALLKGRSSHDCRCCSGGGIRIRQGKNRTEEARVTSYIEICQDSLHFVRIMKFSVPAKYTVQRTYNT
jgi:hypothetical protein